VIGHPHIYLLFPFFSSSVSDISLTWSLENSIYISLPPHIFNDKGGKYDCCDISFPSPPFFGWTPLSLKSLSSSPLPLVWLYGSYWHEAVLPVSSFPFSLFHPLSKYAFPLLNK